LGRDGEGCVVEDETVQGSHYQPGEARGSTIVPRPGCGGTAGARSSGVLRGREKLHLLTSVELGLKKFNFREDGVSVKS
jgi:hypothetical protein